MKRELLLTRVSVVLTVVALCLVCRDIAAVTLGGIAHVDYLQAGTVAFLITALVYGSLVYLVARDGYLRRAAASAHLPLDELEDKYLRDADVPPLGILIPSYKEEPRVLRQTILSAALSVYGSRRIVVLIDDPPAATGKDLASLQASRALVVELRRQFRAAADRVHASYSDFLIRRQRGTTHSPADEMQGVAALYDFLASFVEGLAAVAAAPMLDKADEFLVERIIVPCAQRHRRRASMLRNAAPNLDQVEQELRRLLSHLSVEITSFERKQFRNLSHAPNKAMNLNSYIGLLGKAFRTTRGGEGSPKLEECAPSDADLVVPDACYLLTLDADSMVLPDYVLKLVDVMERDGIIAVAQTPYSAIPGAATPLERAASAQTDLQYIIHQGFTASNATFWVGANALLRVSALRTIRTMRREHDVVVPVYIQDRTVIEDTGSTIDLIRYGWKLHNHPERLAYSATPPDFGSLIIQRRRWSNGGLIIFPDLVRHALEPLQTRPSLGEVIFRTHYLCGPALTAVSVLLLLVLPLNGELLSAWLPATVVPYYALYVRDARAMNYRWREVLNVYTLNLMLLPITLAGVFRSLQQAITGRKSSFGRTPKTEYRTAVPAAHVFLQLGLLLLVAEVAWRSSLHGHVYFASFWAINCALLVAGFVLLIGPKAAWSDVVSAAHWGRLRGRVAGLIRDRLGSREAARNGTRVKAMGASRIIALDGVRAYAVTLVFLVHFFTHYFNGVTGTKRIDFDAYDVTKSNALTDAVAHYFWASHYGVDLFFLLSGFLIFKLVSSLNFSYFSFLRNRFVRLYPAFVIALLVHLLYIATFWNKTIDVGVVASNLLLLHGIWELKIEPIIMPTWSLAYEWLFYIAFPAVLLLPGARARISYWHIALCGLFVLLFVAPVAPYYMRFLMFLVGAALATTSAATLRRFAARIPDAAVIFVYVAANLVFVASQNWYHFIPVYLFTSAALVAKAVYGDGLLHRLFCWRALRRIGNVSYSFYLFHGLALVAFCDHVGPHLGGLPEPVRFFALLTGSFALSLAAAAISYACFERPYFQWRGHADSDAFSNRRSVQEMA